MKQKFIIDRLKILTGKSEDQELANLLGLKKANFSARKQRDSLLDVITEWGINNNVDLNYLLKGESHSNEKVDNKFLKTVEQWIDLKNKDDSRFKVWFEVEFENAFQEFKKWKEEKEESAGYTDSSSTRKVA